MHYEGWSILTRDELANLYRVNSGTKIAKMFGITPAAVYHRMRAYGIKARKHAPGKSAQFSLPKDELAKLYKTTSATKIAEMFGVPVAAVRHRLRVLSIETIKRGPRPVFTPDRGELNSLLQTMSMRDIAKHYGVGETVVFKRIKDYGLNGPTRSERLSRYAKRRPDEHKRKIVDGRAYLVGPLAPGWRGGVTASNKLGRSNKAYRAWKSAVLAKTEFKCSQCGVQQGAICECCGSKVLLHAHHIKPFSGNEELRYDADNGIALCGKCHRQEHFGKVGELLETPKALGTTA